MNNKILLLDLANGTALRSGLPKKESEAFVRAFFELISQSLVKDKIVKVKGLGTFKIVEVEGRDSVNVNNGERIHISGHSKITFTPDSSIRDAVNRPFAAFESIILNEGVTFDPVEEIDAERTSVQTSGDAQTKESAESLLANVPVPDIEETATEDDMQADEEPQLDEEPLIEEGPKVIEEVHSGMVSQAEADTDQLEEESITGDVSDEVVAKVAIQEETAIEGEDKDTSSRLTSESSPAQVRTTMPSSPAATEPPVVSATNSEQTDNPVASTWHRPVNVYRPRYVVNHSSRFADCSLEELDRQDELFSWKRCALKTILVLLLMAVSYIAGSIHLIDNGCKPEPQVTTKPSTSVVSGNKSATKATPKAHEVQSDSVVLSQHQEKREDVDTQVQEPQQTSTVPSAGTTVSSTPKTPSQVEPSVATPSDNEMVAADASAYPQLQGGAYDIVGVKGTHTVRVGETVNSIALSELGSKEMSRYIILLNHLSNPDVINVGSRLKIPQLSHR